MLNLQPPDNSASDSPPAGEKTPHRPDTFGRHGFAPPMRSVLTERESLVGLRTQWIPEEPLATALAKIKSKRAGAVIEESSQVLFFHPLKQVVHIFEVIITRSDVIPLTVLVGFTVDRREH